jgi:hypothetical protein
MKTAFGVSAKNLGVSAFVTLSFAAGMIACGKSKPTDKKNSGAQYNGGRTYPNGLDGTPLSVFDVRVPLGYGYDTDGMGPTQRTCLEGTSEIVRINRSEVNMNASYSFDEFQKKVNGGGSAGFSVWGVTIGGSAKYVEEMKTRTNSLHFGFSALNVHNSRVFKVKSRDELYKDAANDEWKSDCGQAYVAAQDFGSSLSVLVELTNFSSDFKKEVGGDLSVGIRGFGSLKASLTNSEARKKVSGTITVNAWQVGGDSGALLGIFKSPNNGSGAVSGTAECQLDAVKDPENKMCLEILKAVEKYATVDFPEQLKTFNDKSDKEDVEGGPSIVASYVVKYPTRIFSDTNPFDRRLVEESRKNLGTYYQEEMAQVNEVSAKIGKNPSETLKEVKGKMEENLKFIREESGKCFSKSTFDECNAIAVEAGERVAETQVPEGDDEAVAAPAGE